MDLGKQQPLDADPKSIPQINFTENLDQNGNTKNFYYRRSERNH